MGEALLGDHCLQDSLKQRSDSSELWMDGWKMDGSPWHELIGPLAERTTNGTVCIISVLLSPLSLSLIVLLNMGEVCITFQICSF